jgi:hypothetical protein
MNDHPVPASHWRSTSFGLPEGNAPDDLDTLHAHLTLCQRSRRSAFFLRGTVRELGAFLLSRVISTLLIAVLLLTSLLKVL